MNKVVETMKFKWVVMAAAIALASIAAVVVTNEVNAQVNNTIDDIAPVFACGKHRATIVGSSGPDVRVGTPGPDVIAGLGGNDWIYGLGGNDVICGDKGNDHLYGGAGNDTIYAADDSVDYGSAGPGFDACAVDLVDDGLNVEYLDEITSCEPTVP